MNDFQIYAKKYSKLSLHKNLNKKKMRNLPTSLNNIFYNKQNGLEISSQYSKYQNFKNRKLDENFKNKHNTYNSNNKNLSYPINTTSSNKSINSIIREYSLNNLKKKIEIFNSKKTENLNKYNSKENTFNNITNINYFKIMNGMPNKHNIKINILPRKSNSKFISSKDINISLNTKNFKGKSLSKSKSNSKSKNKNENKSYNNKVNNNINKIIIDNYLKLYKKGEKEFANKNTRNKLNYLYKEYPRNNSNKYSNESHKISPKNMLNYLKFKGVKRKNKSSNLLITNFNKSKNIASNSKNQISAIKKEHNNKLKSKSNKNDNNNKNNKKSFKKEKIMHLISKKEKIKKKNSKNKKDNKISSRHTKNNNKNKIINIIITKAFNNNNNKNSVKYFCDKNQSKENKYNMNKEVNKEPIIYDYSNNNILNRKIQNINKKNANTNGSKKNLIINTQYDNNDDNLYKLLNERLKTEYNDNSLEAIDKMFEDNKVEEMTQKSKSLSKRDSYKFLYPEIYMKDDEDFLENDNDSYNYNDSYDKREKELDETESPLKVDTYKEENENSGILSFDQVKDIICYYNMNSRSKQNDFLFKENERENFNINSKDKYLNFFF